MHTPIDEDTMRRLKRLAENCTSDIVKPFIQLDHNHRPTEEELTHIFQKAYANKPQSLLDFFILDITTVYANPAAHAAFLLKITKSSADYRRDDEAGSKREQYMARLKNTYSRYKQGRYITVRKALEKTQSDISEFLYFIKSAKAVRLSLGYPNSANLEDWGFIFEEEVSTLTIVTDKSDKRRIFKGSARAAPTLLDEAQTTNKPTTRKATQLEYRRLAGVDLQKNEEAIARKHASK